MIYQLYIRMGESQPDAATTLNSTPGWSFAFDVSNSLYQQFKKDIQNGVVLNDAEGNPITGDALKTFLATLP